MLSFDQREVSRQTFFGLVKVAQDFLQSELPRDAEIVVWPIEKGRTLEHLAFTFAAWNLGLKVCPYIGFEKHLQILDKNFCCSVFKRLPEILKENSEDAKTDVEFKPAASAGYVFFTSGSTGLPKLILNSVSSILENAKATLSLVKLDSSDKIFVCSSIRFTSIFCHFLYSIMSGCSFQLDEVSLAPEIKEKLITSEATFFGGAPIQVSWILSVLRKSKVRKIFISGDFISGKLAADLDVAMLSGTEVFNCYGMSEVGGRLCLKKWTKGSPTTSVGKVLSFATLKSKRNEITETIVKSDLLPSHYLCGNTIRDKNGDFRPGDLILIGRDSEVTVIGRNRDTFKINGEFVSGRVVAATVQEQFPNMIQSYYGMEIDDSDRKLLYFAFQHKEKVTDDNINEIKKIIYINYGKSAVPTRIIQIDDWPYLKSGKLDLNKIKVMVLANHDTFR